MLRSWFIALALTCGLAILSSPAADADAARRGEKALLGRSFNPPFWSKQAYEDVWKQWEGVTERPADYARALQDRYGLHPAPYPNGGYPMGMREMSFLLRTSVSNDCLLCHGGSIGGTSYVGLGNASLDMQTLYEELNVADGRAARTPFTFCNVRGTNEAGGMSVFLIAYRDADLNFHTKPVDLGLRDDLCEDVPAWWLLRKKQTMYHTGGTSSRSVRSLMQFMMHPLNSGEAIQKEEATFQDIQAYLFSLTPPKYPFPIDETLARRGEAVFAESCARCHGTYGANPTYPNKVVALDVIGTDRTRFDGISEKFGRHYNQTWFAREQAGWLVDEGAVRATDGYQAPPLDGVWATAPYFHNGSAPTVADVLNSKGRPRFFTRSYRTGLDEYDPGKLGWKVRVLDGPADPKLPGRERRKVYDTTQPGRDSAGHTFGDKLSDDERRAVIEYLKTL